MAIPLIHLTDLYHPPQDPDDQFDLATILALPEYDLRGVVLDCTTRFTRAAPEGWDIPRDPGLVTVLQAGVLAGRSIPVAVGPREPLRGPEDDCADRARAEQAGVDLLLSLLEAATEPVLVSVVGSARVLAAAFNRNPALLRERVGGILLNAGATEGAEMEWNVALDPAAYLALWQSGLPIRWYPCATADGAFDPTPERGTHWSATHEELLAQVSGRWRGWFAYGLSGCARGDILRALDELGQGATWEHLLPARRCLWSTASLVMGVGRELRRTAEGWRFMPAESAEADESWPWRLDPINASIDADARVTWSETSKETPHTLFGRRVGPEYGTAMAEAMAALLGTLPVD